jgi:hypothetical protein
MGSAYQSWEDKLGSAFSRSAYDEVKAITSDPEYIQYIKDKEESRRHARLKYDDADWNFLISKGKATEQDRLDIYKIKFK